MFYLFVVLAIGFFKCLTISRLYKLLPLSELRRRARQDEKDAAIYKVAVQSRLLDVLLWFFAAASGTGLIIIAAGYSWWAAFLTGFIMAWLIARPLKLSPDGWLWSLAARFSPAVYKIVDFLSPVLRPIAQLAEPARQQAPQIYEKQDLLDLISNLKRSALARISSTDLDIAAGSLKFSDAKVASVMTPKKQMRFVSASEVVGPKLMDELFATGFKMFPVVRGSAKAAQPEVIGTLDLKTLLKKLESGGKVETIIRRDVYFINEDDSLSAALDAILKHHHQLLCVVNNFEEIVGVIPLEQILAQIIGELPINEFDDHASLRAVAGHHALKESPHDEPISERVVKS